MSGLVSQELIDNLVRIGMLKNRYPFRERSMFNELGLYVQMKSWKGMTSLKAGGKFISRINLYQPRCGEGWEVKKYKPGEWQGLVKSTLELAEWLHKWEGLGGPIAELDFKEAVQGFRKTGVLKLPSTDEVEYFKALSGLIRAFREAVNVIAKRMKVLDEQIQSGYVLMLVGLDIGSKSLANECESIEATLRQIEKLKVPERLSLLSAALLAFMRAGAKMSTLARDCHRIWEDQEFGDPTTGYSDLRAKVEEFRESAREYKRLHQEHQNILNQLQREDEATLKARLAAKG